MAHHLDGMHFCLALASVALLGVGRQGGFYPLTFPDVTTAIGIFPNGCFRRCYPFMDLFRNLHDLKHSTSFHVGFHIKISSLKIGFPPHEFGTACRRIFLSSSCVIFLVTSDTWNRGRIFSFPSTLQQNAWMSSFEVYTLRTSSHVSAWKSNWLGRNTPVNPLQWTWDDYW